eukprot:4132878-Amphidinium_carterae.1
MAGPMESRCAARNGEDRRGIPYTRSDRDVTGGNPGMGRPRKTHAETDDDVRYMDPASHCQGGQHVETVRK